MKECGTVCDVYEFKLNLFHITDVVDVKFMCIKGRRVDISAVTCVFTSLFSWFQVLLLFYVLVCLFVCLFVHTSIVFCACSYVHVLNVINVYFCRLLEIQYV